MPTHKLILNELSELPAIAKQLLALSGNRKVFAIHGEMGMGKTTLIKEICRQLGSTDNFSSPTYSIVNEYRGSLAKQPIYHIDLYRLNNLNEALELGMEEYVDGAHYCFIEWPELIQTLLPPDVIRLDITMQGNKREIAIFIQ